MVQQQQILVFSYDYFPGMDFDVIARMETSTTVRVLQTADGDTVPEISQPDDYTGHIIRYDLGNGAGITSFLFLRTGSMDPGDTETMGDVASMFSSQLNLLQTTLD